MKFGKTIQARQIPGWGPYYLDYKFLKKIINSLASRRPASEASLLAVGIRPSLNPTSSESSNSTPTHPLPQDPSISIPSIPTNDQTLSPQFLLSPELGASTGGGLQASPLFALGGGGSGQPSTAAATRGSGSSAPGGEGSSDGNAMDLEPLPPGAEPPTAGVGSGRGAGRMGMGNGNGGMGMGLGGGRGDRERDESFKAHRAVFFFKLGRELEKINAFYLTKERDLRLRILALLNNRKRLLLHHTHSSTSTADNEIDDIAQTLSFSHLHKSAEWANLEEAWRLFEKDLGKLQQFIDINATGFRKILKKWDKRSKSNTKELYLERQVEIQPCFNRECITKMADIVTANLLDLGRGSSHLNTSFLHDLPDGLGADGLHFEREVSFEGETASTINIDAVSDLEFDLDRILADQTPEGVEEWLESARMRQSHSQAQGDSRLMRLVWRAIEELQPQYLETVLSGFPVDFTFVDKINGRRPLHEAAITGRKPIVDICLERGISPAVHDVYGRYPLHYAAMHGHADICEVLLQNGADPTAVDLDGHTSLIQAVISGQVGCVEILVKYSTSKILEPSAISNDLIPLSLACQHGRLEVARLLLRSGAKVLPNSEGLYPQHLAARAGHADICRLLVEEAGADGGGKDRRDKYNLWTPMHHACVGGTERHTECLKVLVQAGCDINAVDEYGKSPGFYAAWYGQIDCLNFLVQAGADLKSTKSPVASAKTSNLGLGSVNGQETGSPNSDGEDDMMLDQEAELIPSLSLPPPIIPLRMYGHDFLAKRNLVQVTLGHPVSEASSDKRVFPVKLYSRSEDDNLLDMWSSLKLVMTSKLDPSVMPHSIVLPLADERETFGFHVEDLSKFALELSLYPTFGSKVIGRAVILSSTIQNIHKSELLQVPLLDHHLKAIGEVAFYVECIRPFADAQLEIGGRVETYWKSTTIAPPTSAAQDHAHQFQPHRPLSVSTTSPSMRSTPGQGTKKAAAKDVEKSGFVTASSLAGDYLHMVVQVTRDYIPVVHSNWALPYPGLTLGVSDVTGAQYTAISNVSLHQAMTSRFGGNLAQISLAEWHQAINTSNFTLEDILMTLPSNIGAHLEVRYTSETDASREGLIAVLDLNKLVDAVLQTVYKAARSGASSDPQSRNRRIVFSGYDATLCTHVQLKQPNFAVFYSSLCHVTKSTRMELIQARTEDESLSVREAVKLAKSQNMLGVALDARILIAVPALIQSVKDAGLLLIALGPDDILTLLRQTLGSALSIDGYMSHSILTLTA